MTVTRRAEKRLLVTGSRNWEDREAVLIALARVTDEWPDDVITLVHGACPTGADHMADDIWSGFLGRPVERHPANWHRFGKGAGPRRNQEMVDLGADLCLAFILPGSRGTANCVRCAEAAGIPVRKVFGVKSEGLL